MEFDEIGLMIRQARKSKKLSQQMLGQQLGMSRATLSGIENATVPEIGIRKILSLCGALGLELVAQEKSSRPTLQQLMKENQQEEEMQEKKEKQQCQPYRQHRQQRNA